MNAKDRAQMIKARDAWLKFEAQIGTSKEAQDAYTRGWEDAVKTMWSLEDPK